MTIPFQELAGSPVEQYSSDGFTATRKFLVPWIQRESFARWLLGTAESYGTRESVTYPNQSDVTPWQLKIVPYDDSTIEKQTMSQPSEALNSYDGLALITVDYKTTTQQDIDDGPSAETGTRLTYRITYESNESELNPVGAYWSNTSVSLTNADGLVKRIPQTIHLLTWQQVLYPPWTAIRELQGRVNNADFLSCPAETLLFDGVTVNKLFRGDLQNGASDFCWSLEYRFRQKIVYQNANVCGWNHGFRGETGAWERIQLGSAGSPVSALYESGDFSKLFVSEYSQE